MNSAEAFGFLRESHFYQNIKGALAHAVQGDWAGRETGPDIGDPRVLRRLIAAEFDGPGA